MPKFSGKISDPCKGGTNRSIKYMFVMGVEQNLTKYQVNKLQTWAAWPELPGLPYNREGALRSHYHYFHEYFHEFFIYE